MATVDLSNNNQILLVSRYGVVVGHWMFGPSAAVPWGWEYFKDLPETPTSLTYMSARQYKQVWIYGDVATYEQIYGVKPPSWFRRNFGLRKKLINDPAKANAAYVAGPSKPSISYKRIKQISRQVFIATKYANPNTSGYVPLPAKFDYDNGSGESACNFEFDQDIAVPPFTEGAIHVSGYNNYSFDIVVNVELISVNSEYSTFLVPPGSWQKVIPMTPQAILDLNNGLYATFPGAAQMKYSAFNTITSLVFRVS